jgi:hypothetical protein
MAFLFFSVPVTSCHALGDPEKNGQPDQPLDEKKQETGHAEALEPFFIPGFFHGRAKLRNEGEKEWQWQWQWQ